MKNLPHFLQLYTAKTHFYVYSKKSLKNCDFWIDFVETLEYNRKATDLTFVFIRLKEKKC